MSSGASAGAGVREVLQEPGQAARNLFGDRFGLAERYAELLAGDGVAHGHLGPRELPRLWSRHLLNCAVVTELIPHGVLVVDVGSGAGLPGIVLAVRRPDLRVVLVEPMQRRVDFLQRCVDELGLDGVRVVRGRADDRSTLDAVGPQAWVTARAVAPLERLVRWCLPLLMPGGTLLALKGRSAEDEARRDSAALARLGAVVRGVTTVPVEDDVTRVVVVTRSGHTDPKRRRS